MKVTPSADFAEPNLFPTRNKSCKSREIVTVEKPGFVGAGKLPMMSNPVQSGPPVQAATSLFNELVANPNVGARRMSIAPGTVLYEPETAANNLYYIHRGQIRTYHVGQDHYGRLIDILGPDAWFGEAALAKQASYGEQAIAVVPSVVSEIPAERFLSLLVQTPRSAIEVYRQLAAKLTVAR